MQRAAGSGPLLLVAASLQSNLQRIFSSGEGAGFRHLKFSFLATVAKFVCYADLENRDGKTQFMVIACGSADAGPLLFGAISGTAIR